ncbi:MAG: type I 3-dehydroquinate dehydratase [Archaeoglobaceae archaeon]
MMHKIKLVATVSSDEELNLANKADVVEFRLDFGEIGLKTDKEKILTIRRKADGGNYNGTEEERLDKILELSKNFEYVDLEFDCPDFIFEALSKRAKLIESYHNFKETPEYDFLEYLVENKRGDLFKIATMGRSYEDVKKIVKLLLEYEDLVAFLMGEKFSFTRILSAFLGSPFIYCYVGTPKAPGQVELNSTFEMLSRLGLR